MHDEDAWHPNKTLQDKLEYIYQLRRNGDPKGRVNFNDNSNYQALLEAFNNPHLRLPPVIHLAGTNGKGSTLATLRSIYEAAGYRVHAYTSPHLKTFNERIYLAGRQIDDVTLNTLLDETFMKNDGHPVTFFEFTTAMAFEMFTRGPADIVLLETGMGGRLDCTNVVPAPTATIITQIAFDHMQFLGDNLRSIATEKAGIIKPESPCLIAPQTGEFHNSGALDIIKNKAVECFSPLYIAGEHWTCAAQTDHMVFCHPRECGDRVTSSYPKPNLPGAHQIDNAGTALAAVNILQDRFPVKSDDIAAGLQHIHWPGRLERITSGTYADFLPENWQLWFDGAHNPEGALALAAQIQTWKAERDIPVHIILAMKEGKDIDGVKAILKPLAASLTDAEIGDDLAPAIQDCLSHNAPETPALILIAGSFYNY